VLAVARAAGQPFVLPSAKNAKNGTYPIARDLYMYSAGQPSGAIKDYLEWIRGPQGQAVVVELGFVPLQ
jgi:phosphate transport system substrate-binding protein